MSVLKLIFFISFFLLFYHFLIFPLLVSILSRFIHQSVQKKEFFPFVSVVIPVFNEEETIEEKIRNCLEQEYPKDKIEFIFASDGSTDSTNSILGKYFHDSIKPIYLKRQGKSETLNEAVKDSKGEIVVFTDVTCLLNREAIKNIVFNFADSGVGAVCGIYHIEKSKRTAVDEFELEYLGWDISLRRNLSKIYTSIGGHGGLYAIRKALYKELDSKVINDDYIIPAQAVLAGYRLVYEDKARIFDCISTDWKTEFRRKVRIAYGNLQQVIILRRLLNPKRLFVCWVFFSHKVIRALQPILIICLIVGVFLLKGIMYRVFLAFFIIFILVSFLGFLSMKYKYLRLFSNIFLLSLGLYAQIVGALKFILRRKISW